MLGTGLASGIGLKGEDVAHFAGIAGDNRVSACAIGTVAADRDERDTIPRPLRAELVSGEFIGKQPQQVAEPAQHNSTAERIKGAGRPSRGHDVFSLCRFVAAVGVVRRRTHVDPVISLARRVELLNNA